MKNNLNPTTLVALGEAGVIPYISEVRILDLWGLMDKNIARSSNKIGSKVNWEYFKQRKPEVCLFTRNEGDSCNFRFENAYCRLSEFKEMYDRTDTLPYFSIYRLKTEYLPMDVSNGSFEE